MSEYHKILSRLPLVLPPVGVLVSPISPNNAGEVNPTATLPGVPAIADLLFAHVMAAAPGANTVFTPPAGQGWTSLATAYDTTGGDTRAQVFMKQWGMGFTDLTTIAFAASTGNSRLVVQAIRRGLPAFTSGATPGSSAIGTPTLVAGSVTAPAFALVLRFYTAAANTVNVTPNLGIDETTLYGGIAYDWSNGTDGAMAATSAPRLPGPTDTGTATASVAGVTNGWTSISLALAGASSFPIVQTVSAISADVASPNPTNTIAGGTPNAGDVILANLANSAGGLNVVTPPAGEGWAQVTNVLSSTGADSSTAVWWKRWGAGFVDNTTVTFTAGGNSRLVLTRISGCVAAGTPFDAAMGVTVGSDDAANDRTVRAPTLVLPSRSLVLRFYSASATGIILNAPDVIRYSGLDYAFDAGGNGAMACSADLALGSAPVQSAQANTNTANGWVGISVAVPFVSTF